MTLLENGEIIADDWVFVASTERLPNGGHVVIDVERWQFNRANVLALNGPLGIQINNDFDVGLLADDLHRFDLVALNFPAYTDGRAYSQARQLRSRYGFKGKIRARGDVLRDQLPLMVRSGFDSFEASKNMTPSVFKQATTDMSGTYQV